MTPGDLMWWSPPQYKERLPVEVIDRDPDGWIVCWIHGVVERVLESSLTPMHPLEALARRAKDERDPQ